MCRISLTLSNCLKREKQSEVACLEAELLDWGQVLGQAKRQSRAPVRILNAGIAEMRAIVMFCKFFAVYLQDS